MKYKLISKMLLTEIPGVDWEKHYIHRRHYHYIDNTLIFPNEHLI